MRQFVIPSRHHGTAILKTILLHINDDAEQNNRLQVALDLARFGQGHIMCVQIAAVEPYIADPYGAMFGLATIIDTIHENDKRSRQTIESRLQSDEVDWDWRCFDGSVVETIIAQSRLADLVVISQPGLGRPEPDTPVPIVADVVLHSSAPVLMVPTGDRRFDADGAAILAWNGSAEAAQAMRLTVPLLKRASCVHIVEVSGDSHGTPADQAAIYLARHGIACDVHEWPAKGRRTSQALLQAVLELDARYLVMGAYGHSRLRETVLGSVTRELIRAATVPLLLAH